MRRRSFLQAAALGAGGTVVTTLIGGIPAHAAAAGWPKRVQGGYYPTPAKLTEALDVIKEADLSTVDAITVTSLQGILAKKQARVYMIPQGKPTEYNLWLKDLVDNYRVTANNRHTFDSLLKKYADDIDGYVLYDYKLNPTDVIGGLQAFDPSINVATSLAGVLNALMIAPSQRLIAEAHGLKLLIDVRGTNDQWLKNSAYWPRLNKSIIGELENRQGYETPIRDYAILANAAVIFPGNTALRQSFLDDMEPDAGILGWGDWYGGEDTFVRPSSKSGAFYVAANFAYNLTALSGGAVGVEDLRQHTLTAVPSADPSKHYVSFLFTDGDNLQFTLGGMQNWEQWFGSPARGTIPMGWGLPAAQVSLAPSANAWYYRNASPQPNNDAFVLYGSGGYMYPSMYPPAELDIHLDRLDGTLQESDLGVVSVIDFDAWDRTDVWDKYTSLPHLEGLIYVPYIGYRLPDGPIRCSNGKPIIAPKYVMWAGLYDDTNTIQEINAAPADLSSAAGYSLVIVHAWSKTMADVAALAKQLGPNAEVVDPVTLTRLIAQNVCR